MRGRVASDEEAVEVTAGVFIQVRLIEWTNNPQPRIVDHKQYAASAGLVFETPQQPTLTQIRRLLLTPPVRARRRPGRG